MTKDEKRVIVGCQIRNYRKKRNFTQTELAEKVGLSRTYLSDIENGRYMPSVEALSIIAKELKMDLNFLIPMTEIQVKT